MNLFSRIIELVSALGLGALIGIFIKNRLDLRREERARLFTARREAYKNIIGRINNLFLESDTRHLSDSERKLAMNTFFSEALLLGSDQLRNQIEEFMRKNIGYDHALRAEPESESTAKLDQELDDIIDGIESTMRWELGIG